MRDRVRSARRGQGDRDQRVRRGAAVRRARCAPGEIGRLWGLDGARIGDALGARAGGAAAHHFAPPTLETVVVPATRPTAARCTPRSTQLAEQDPLINLRRDELRGEMRSRSTARSRRR